MTEEADLPATDVVDESTLPDEAPQLAKAAARNDDREAWVSINWDQATGTNARKLLADIVRRRNERLDRKAAEWAASRPDPRTLAVPADATVHLRRQDEARVTVDDFGPGSPTVAVMRQSWRGAMRSLADLGEELRAVTAERDLAIAHDRQPYPTADAYEAACAALHKHRSRADRAEAERNRLTGERDGVREELTRMAGDLEDVRATLAVRDGELRSVTRDRDDLAERLARAAVDRDRYRAERDRLGGQARDWYSEATRQAAYRDALHTLAVLYVPADMRRGTALDPDWTPDAPAGPPSAPLAAQEPPVGGIGPTETQRGAEAVGRPERGRSSYVGPGITWTHQTGETITGRAAVGWAVNGLLTALEDAGPPAADVDTVSGASQRREGER